MKRRRVHVADKEEASAVGPIAEVGAPPLALDDGQLDLARVMKGRLLGFGCLELTNPDVAIGDVECKEHRIAL